MKKKTITRKLLLLILSMCIIVCMMPTVAIATSNEDDLHVKFKSNGTITWDKVSEAAWYNVSLRLYSDSTGLYGSKNTAENSFDLKGYMEQYKKETGNYFLLVAAHDKNGSQLKYSYVPYSYTSSLPKLSTPKKLSWSGLMVNWDPVEGATSYEISVIDSSRGTQVKARTYTATATEYKVYKENQAKHPTMNFDGDIPSSGNYYFTVTAKANGYRDSDTAVSDTQNPITEPALAIVKQEQTDSMSDWLNVKLSNGGTLTWDNKGGSYSIAISDYANGVQIEGNLKVTKNSFDAKAFMQKYKKDTGFYCITVSSDKSSGCYETVYLYYYNVLENLPTPTGLKWYGKEAQWNKVEGATSYLFKLVNADTGAVVKTKTYYINSSDAFSLKNAEHPSYNFDGELKDNTNYYFTVTAVADGYKDSATAKSSLLYDVKTISTVTIPGNVYEGMSISNKEFTAPLNTTIESCFWSRNGVGVNYGTKVSKGNSYKATICLKAADWFAFSSNVTANVLGSTVTADEVSTDGKYAWFTTKNVSITNDCNHSNTKYMHSELKHWQVCTDCSAKLNVSDHNFSKTTSGNTVTYTCSICGFQKTGKVAETRTGVYYVSLDLGTAFVGGTTPSTATLNYATIDSTNTDKYYDFATVESVVYSSGSKFGSEKATATVTLKAKENYYFKNSTIAGAGVQYTRESYTPSDDGSTLTVVFSVTPYTPADVTVTLPEFTAGKTYKDVVKETKFMVNGVEMMSYSVSIRENDGAAVVSNVHDGEPTETYLSKVIKPETKYSIVASIQLDKYYGKSITVTNPKAGTVTDFYAGEIYASVDASYMTAAEVDNTNINNINLTVEAPSFGKTPATSTASGKTYSVANVSWSGKLSNGAFTCDKEYAVEITVAKKGEYKFGENVQASVNGYPATVVKSGDMLVVSYTFEKLEHVYSAMQDSNYHWYECSKCGEIKDKEAHTMVDGICSVCGYKESKKIGEDPQEEKTSVDIDLDGISSKASAAYTSKGKTKITATLTASQKSELKAYKEAGYTVKYKFYRSTKKGSGYKLLKTTTSTSYTVTSGTKGKTYYYKTVVSVYDGKTLVDSTKLKNAKAVSKKFKK